VSLSNGFLDQAAKHENAETIQEQMEQPLVQKLES